MSRPKDIDPDIRLDEEDEESMLPEAQVDDPIDLASTDGAGTLAAGRAGIAPVTT